MCNPKGSLYTVRNALPDFLKGMYSKSKEFPPFREDLFQKGFDVQKSGQGVKNNCLPSNNGRKSTINSFTATGDENRLLQTA